MDIYQIKIILIIVISFAIWKEVSTKLNNQVFGLLAAIGAAYLMYTDVAAFFGGVLLFIFYFGFNVIMTILGNIKKVIPI